MNFLLKYNYTISTILSLVTPLRDSYMLMISGLATWYWTTNQGAFPQGKTDSPLSIPELPVVYLRLLLSLDTHLS